MFTADTLIDTVQSGKKTMINTLVQNETVKGSLIAFVDAQTDYTKNATKVGMDTFTTLMKEGIKAQQELFKFDYTKFGEGIMKAYYQNTK